MRCLNAWVVDYNSLWEPLWPSMSHCDICIDTRVKYFLWVLYVVVADHLYSQVICLLNVTWIFFILPSFCHQLGPCPMRQFFVNLAVFRQIGSCCSATIRAPQAPGPAPAVLDPTLKTCYRPRNSQTTWIRSTVVILRWPPYSKSQLGSIQFIQKIICWEIRSLWAQIICTYWLNLVGWGSWGR